MRRIQLEEAEFFHLLRPDQLARVRSRLLLRPFRAGECIYFTSEPAESLWVLRAGEVRTVKISPTGHTTALERFRPGDLFGLAVAVEAASYGETAEGVTQGEAWRAPPQLLAGLVRDDPRLARELLAIVAKRLQGAHDRLCSFAHDSVPARIALLLVEQADGDRLEATRRAIGEAVGTTVETAIRVLRRFDRAGWIEGGVGSVRILDRKALERVARGEKLTD
ncbi:MAG: Crp/Fnr family transcriptional regulator [Deltaproteobacteria bacterium]|nr:MAG: Crp/Fnr family transcriptional regulator [Deltaproteobacteria bacterium]